MTEEKKAHKLYKRHLKSEESSKFNVGVPKKWEYRTIQGYRTMQ